MKKINSELYVVEPSETITIKIETINTENLSAISLDGEPIQPQDGRFEFQASPEKGTTHFLAFAFHFVGSEQSSGTYHNEFASSLQYEGVRNTKICL